MRIEVFVSRVQRLASSDVDQGMMESIMSLPSIWRPAYGVNNRISVPQSPRQRRCNGAAQQHSSTGESEHNESRKEIALCSFSPFLVDFCSRSNNAPKTQKTRA